MATKSNKTEYMKHKYSGPRKNPKKIRAGLMCQEINFKSRIEAWRKNSKNIKKKADLSANKPEQPQPSTYARKTYSRTKPVVKFEASLPEAFEYVNMPSPESTQSTCLDLNWPQLDPTEEAQTLPAEWVPIDNLKGLTGNRIVDIKHVLQWAIDLGKHSRRCECSQIELVNEVRQGMHSVFTFKCTMCEKKWEKSTYKEIKEEQGEDTNLLLLY